MYAYYAHHTVRYVLMLGSIAGLCGLAFLVISETARSGPPPADAAVFVAFLFASVLAVGFLARRFASNAVAIGLIIASVPVQFAVAVLFGVYVLGRGPRPSVDDLITFAIAEAIACAIGAAVWAAGRFLPATRLPSDASVLDAPATAQPLVERLRPLIANAAASKLGTALAYMVVGALAFQGILSIVRPPSAPPSAPSPQQVVVQAPPQKPVDTGIRFTTIAISEKQFWVRTSRNRQDSLKSAQEACSYCRYVGPDYGRCAGYIEFWIASPIIVVGEDAASAEAKAYSQCITRYDREHCKNPKSLCNSGE